MTKGGQLEMQKVSTSISIISIVAITAVIGIVAICYLASIGYNSKVTYSTTHEKIEVQAANSNTVR